MRNTNRYSIEYYDPELYRMESQLGETLRGVAPRPDFVSHLRTRLTTEPVQAENNRRVFQYVLLSLAGIVSGVLLVRGLSALLGYRGMTGGTPSRPAGLTAAEA